MMRCLSGRAEREQSEGSARRHCCDGIGRVPNSHSHKADETASGNAKSLGYHHPSNHLANHSTNSTKHSTIDSHQPTKHTMAATLCNDIMVPQNLPPCPGPPPTGPLPAIPTKKN
ncbi:hypothetical protein GGP41_010614 [Bipolaris sorokiniana]|uniref:Uncharacterized protein n=1 Tax=Cochliobolus sativus TaxID=45130 RepID=A0A8H5ZKU7_COCSA|nr:hypothetical protein GGP41_010614 [Bipolaris sorokiniana]